ncbi:MAG: L-threonylcarbamoyladenylate synthase [Gammaproteobacteria bacterium]|nr:L-threonylcarbamoyladenylate synthase [Gammaproteobacteria bacterium]MCW8909199.1 L-threonylcarbamoyladenylate synthase [Gammaproteobacteria bacterium]MCW9005552.1 L-threonylcarbamoyladenylate synthase [Gammaproteobacteria bacterium]MCW9056833.1 L-threonylcarbamoyladenylate synthase [Gammaproteobacteria bacterium]
MSTRLKLKLAAQQLQKGNVIAYPTESVIGLGCHPLDKLAVQKLLTIKQRSVDKGLILIASHIEQLLPFIDVNEQQFNKLQQKTDKPVTWLVKASPLTPCWLTGNHKKIAVRLTQHPLCKQLCETTGYPVVSTSANRSAQPAAKTILKTRQYFGDMVDYYLSGDIQGYSKPSEIRDLETDEIIRAS